MVPPAAGLETLRNDVRVADDGTNGPDPTPLDNLDNDVDTLDATPDLRVTKDDGALLVIAGQTLTYTITVENPGAVADTLIDFLNDVTP